MHCKFYFLKIILLSVGTLHHRDFVLVMVTVGCVVKTLRSTYTVDVNSLAIVVTCRPHGKWCNLV